MNRRGIFLSLTAVLIVSILIIALQAPVPQADRRVIHTQVQHATNDMERLETTNLPAILASKSREALNLMARRATATPYSSMSELQNTFNACMTTENCADADWTRSMNTTLGHVETLYHEELQYDTRLRLLSATVSEVGPFELVVEGTFDLSLADETNDVAISRVQTVSALINIEGLIDPVRSAQVGEAAVLRERQAVEGPDALSAHAAQGTYLHRNQTPSYLQRLLGGTGVSDQGIYSVLPADHYGAAMSHIDFEPTPPAGTCLYRIAVPEGTIYLPETYLTHYDLSIASGDAALQTGC